MPLSQGSAAAYTSAVFNFLLIFSLTQVISTAWERATEPGSAAYTAGAAAAAAEASAATDTADSRSEKGSKQGSGDAVDNSSRSPSAKPEDSSSSASSSSKPYPTEAACTILYCLAILREHTSPLNLRLAAQLAALHKQPVQLSNQQLSKQQSSNQQQENGQKQQGESVGLPLQDRPDFQKHAKQVGVVLCVCLL